MLNLGTIISRRVRGVPLFLNRCEAAILSSTRGIATATFGLHLPPPPPREFNPDGTPRKYRLNQPIYDHKYDWERWRLKPAGVFHTVYYGEFGRELSPLKAWLLSVPVAVSIIPLYIFFTLIAFLINCLGLVGIRPRRFTYEWMEASKERDRAENSNPITRYLDRRRKERGPNWIAEDYLPNHPFALNMSRYHHDKDLLRLKNESKD